MYRRFCGSAETRCNGFKGSADPETSGSAGIYSCGPKKWMEAAYKRWPDLHVTVEEIVASAHPEDASDKPQYNHANELLRPANYREWIFLSAGLGMNYSSTPGSHDMFTNVFVPQWAYKEFLKSGQWPDKTIFVVEERGAQTKGSINKHGNFQTTDLMGIGVEVKDSSLPDKWAYFNFDDNQR